MKIAIGWIMWFVLILVVLVWYEWPESRVVATICDVGQGDGMLVSQGFSQMLVDVGLDDGKINNCLSKGMPFWDRNLEVVIITHGDSDHMGGLKHLLDTYKIRSIITTQAALQKVSEVVGNRVPVSLSWQGQHWEFGKMRSEVLWPKKNVYFNPQISKVTPGETNRQSLVFRLEINNQESIWFAGDADAFVEEQLVNSNLVKETTYLKVGHHGSRTSSSEPFLTIVRPRQIWISVGKNNHYGHPSREVMDLFIRMKIPVSRTDELGTFRKLF